MSPTGEPFDPSLIIFAALAVFVVWKLRSVLGVRVDRDAPPQGRFEPRSAPLGPAPLPGAAPSETVAVARGEERWKDVVGTNAAAGPGLDAIAAVDPRFDGPAFIEGARRAYEMIVTAFSRGDRDTLRPLLSKEVFDSFANEIARREAAGETFETAIVSLDGASVDAARTEPRLSEITVRFAARLINVRRDKSGEVIEGGHTTPVEELWTFARDPRASEPNWKLTATRAV